MNSPKPSYIELKTKLREVNKMLDRLKDFKKDCESFVGKEATDVPIGAEVADWLTIRLSLIHI